MSGFWLRSPRDGVVADFIAVALTSSVHYVEFKAVVNIKHELTNELLSKSSCLDQKLNIVNEEYYCPRGFTIFLTLSVLIQNIINIPK